MREDNRSNRVREKEQRAWAFQMGIRSSSKSQISPARQSAVLSSRKLAVSASNPMRLTQRTDTKSSALAASGTEANIACDMM